MQYCLSNWHGCIRLRWKGLLLSLIAVSLFLPRIGFSADGLTVKFIDESHSGHEVYVAFGGQTNPAKLVGGIIGGKNLELGTSYSLADLNPGIHLTRFDGRICIALGSPFRSVSPETGNNPNFNDPSLPDFNIRWDKAEITYDFNDPFSTINLSATDFFSVRLRIRTYHAGNLVTTLTWQKGIATAFRDTGLLSGFSRLSRFSDGAVCLGDFGVSTLKSIDPPEFVRVLRVISPSSTIREFNFNPYPSFQDYTDFVRRNAIITKIEGKFLGQPAATYEFTALIDSAGGLVMIGTITTNSVPQSHVILISDAELNKGVYTADPLCIIDGKYEHPGSTAFGAAVRDALAGFSYGFIGSKEPNPNAPGLTFGQSASDQWYTPPLPISYAFAGAQPHSLYYNQYASVLARITDAYGFPYSDLVQKPLASLNPAEADTVEITILAD